MTMGLQLKFGWFCHIREGKTIIGTTVPLDADEAKRDAKDRIKAN